MIEITSRQQQTQRTWLDWPRSKKLKNWVRSEKTCISEGESPSSLEARLPEFGTKVMDGKV